MTPREETNAIIARTAEPYGFTLADMLSHKRDRPYYVLRQATYANVEIARPLMSLPAIGRHFAGRDHTTILHGIRQHHARMAVIGFLIACVPVEDDQLDLFRDAA